MNMVLWILQVLLAFHTLTGAIWKFSNSEQSVPSLSALPHGLWLALSPVEIVCALMLVLPFFKKSLGRYVSKAALFVVAEMLLFTVINLTSGIADSGPMIYWLVVAAICSFLAFGRYKLRPIQ